MLLYLQGFAPVLPCSYEAVRRRIVTIGASCICFGESFVSAMMVLCSISYYIVAVIGLGITFSWHKVRHLALLLCKAFFWSSHENRCGTHSYK